ncbi:MAG: hypothetical protein ACOCYR_00125 [Erythrobacter sp.]
MTLLKAVAGIAMLFAARVEARDAVQAFAKIGMIAQPGDRILVLAGRGQATWPRHFVERTPGFALVEAMPYLEKGCGTLASGCTPALAEPHEARRLVDALAP